MTQALYAHINNKTIKKKEIVFSGSDVNMQISLGYFVIPETAICQRPWGHINGTKEST
jgi:hypothetical protein